MLSVGVIGNSGKEIAKTFLRMYPDMIQCYHITEDTPPPTKVNVLVAAEPSPLLASVLPTLGYGDYLVVNADDRRIFPLLDLCGAKLITYGFNTRACITASSVTRDDMQICIQRAFYGIDGAERVPCEFSAKLDSHESSFTVLGAAAVCAVLSGRGL